MTVLVLASRIGQLTPTQNFQKGQRVKLIREGMVEGLEESSLRAYGSKKGVVMVVVRFEDGTVDRFGAARAKHLQVEHTRKMPVLGPF